jgi:hypothetical protein
LVLRNSAAGTQKVSGRPVVAHLTYRNQIEHAVWKLVRQTALLESDVRLIGAAHTCQCQSPFRDIQRKQSIATLCQHMCKYAD